jgi:3-hydroxyisobutyrate dehydrogenase
MTETTHFRVAYIGLGRMGHAMARRLLAAGHQVDACDVDAAAVARLVDEGARACDGPGQVAAEAAVTITCLPTPTIVEEVILGAGGVLSGAPADSIVIDMSTSSPTLARRLAQAGREQRVDVLDAPVSGGPRGAIDGTLAVMVGGEEPAFARVRPLLDELGGVVRHMGPAGSGQATKLTNNLLAGAHMVALTEAVALAEREHLDPASVYEVWSSGTGDSRVLRNRFPVPGVLEHAPASHDWAALFPVDLLTKDLGLALDCAEEHDLSMELTQVALARYRAAQEAGLGALDYSAVMRLLEPEDDQ